MKQKLLVPYTFVMMNWAAVISLYHFFRAGKNIHKDVWVMPSSVHVQPSGTAAEQVASQDSKAA
jgi:hypothetical protein